MIELLQYDKSRHDEWNMFVRQAKNAVFMHEREYMEYHSDRFIDNSLMAYDKGKLIAVLPCNINNGCAYSHQGLTFGGLLLPTAHVGGEKVLEIFEAIKSYLKSKGINTLIYKPSPHIYHSYPSEEDLYAVFRQNGVLISSGLSSSIEVASRIRFNENSRRGVKSASASGITVGKSDRWEEYWSILQDTLYSCHNTLPVHTVEEIKHLNSLFPENILLYTAQSHDIIEAGVVMYVSKNVAHAQYIAASASGKEKKALPLLFDWLINKEFIAKKYFDFGISTEDNGAMLNQGLISQKEGFGGRGVVYNSYKVNI